MDKKTILRNLFNDMLTTINQSIRVESESVRTSIVNHTLINLLLSHKLDGKIEFDETLDSKLNLKFDSNIRNKLVESKMQAQIHFEKQCDIIRQISRHFQSSNITELPVVIKGVSTFFLTRDRSNLKFSSDIDLIYSEPIVLEKILGEMGFVRLPDDSVTDHEYCHMVKDDIVIDIHKYIPVINYSSGTMSKALKASASDFNIIFESFTKIATEMIEYSEIYKESSPCKDLGGILIPNSSMQILISCAHTFRNYINSLFHYSSGIKLADLLDIIDLINHRSFDASQLQRVITTDTRYNSVSFVGYLLRTIINYSYLSEIFSPNLIHYPKHLFWDGTMYMPSHKHEFIYHPIHQLTKKLNSTFIRSILDDQSIVTSQQYNSHSIVHIEFVSIKKTGNRLILKIQVSSIPSFTTRDSFEIVCNDVEFSFLYSDNTLTHEVKKNNYEVTIIKEHSKYAAVIDIPINDFLIAPWIPLGIVIKVTRWGNGPVSTLIPLHIDFSELNMI